MTTLNTGVNESLSTDEATEALLGRWTDAEKPSVKDKGAASDEGDEITPDETEDEYESDESAETGEDEDVDTDQDEADADADDEQDANEGEDEEAPEAASDDAVVSIMVNGESQTVTVKDLKRLYGQEAALTRKSQEVAEAKRKIEQDGARYMVASQKLLERAQERFAPYAKIDWMVAQKRLSDDEFSALRQEALAAHQEVQFLENEAEGVLAEVQQAQTAANAEAARETVRVLERDIPGWNREVYDNVRQFAVDSGMDANTVNQIIDPTAIKIMHMAMKYSRMKTAAAPKKKAVAAAPKRAMKPSGKTAALIGSKKTEAASLARLKQSGSKDDAVNALMERWSSSDD